MAGRTPALPVLPVDAARPGTAATSGWDAVGCETRLDERRDRGWPDMGDACDNDMVDWYALSMRRSLAAEPLTDMERESPSDNEAIDDSPDVVVICATAVSQSHT